MGNKIQEAERLRRLLTLEQALYVRGYKAIAGMDEAGRGPLAGPVVAACVVMPKGHVIQGINDSKKINASKRESLYWQIREHACCIGVGMADHAEIDEVNILVATRRAFERAYAQIAGQADYVLMDYITGVGITDVPVQAVVHGDALVYSIAAASIIAKVERDKIMCGMHADYPQYGFDEHKGYGTQKHRQALLQYGPCVQHRRSFLKKILSGE